MNAISEVYVSVTDNMLKRTANPLIGAFVVSWVFINWDIILLLFFSKNSIENKINIVNSMLDNTNSVIYYPILFTIFYTLFFPWITYTFIKVQEFHKRKDKTLRVNYKLFSTRAERAILKEEKKNSIIKSNEFNFHELFNNEIKKETEKIREEAEKIKEEAGKICRNKLQQYGIVEGDIPEKDTNKKFDSDLNVGIAELLQYFSSNALAFIGYYRTSDLNPIVYDARLSKDENLRFLKNIRDGKPEDIYNTQIGNFENIISSINDDLALLQQGVLERCIFDLEHGGVLFYKLSQHEYLIGVCLDQLKFYQADHEMRAICQETQKYLGINSSWE